MGRFDPEALTPYRASSAIFDISERVPTELPFGMARERGQIKPDPNTVSNLIQWRSGVWSLKPVNFDRSAIVSLATPQSYIIRKSEGTAATGIVEFSYGRQLSELTGVTYAAGSATSNDWFMRKTVAAGSSWTEDINPTTASIAYPSFTVNMDRMFECPNEQAMTGYQVALVVPGTPAGPADWIAGFYFGGAVLPDGRGQFMVQVSGSGRMALAEFINGSWQYQEERRFQGASHTQGNVILLTIVPHFPNYIEIGATTGGFDQSTLIGMVSEYAVQSIQPEKPTLLLHEITNRGTDAWDGDTLRPVTGAGYCGIEIRRDLRVAFQISRLVYPASGSMIDRPFQLPPGITNSHILKYTPSGFNFNVGGSDVTSAALSGIDYTSQAALTPGAETILFDGLNRSLSGFVIPGGVNGVQTLITLSNSESGLKLHSPAFLGYQVQRVPDTVTIANGEKRIALRGATITGPDISADHESATVRISDATDSLPLLRTRGKSPVRLVTTYDPADATKTSILFEGYTGRVEARRRGKLGRSYPSPTWHDYDVQLLGKWDRLEGRFFWGWTSFADDHTSPGGHPASQPAQPWKVTDIIKWVLWQEGFRDDQVSIGDDTIRLFLDAVSGRAVDLAYVAPGTRVQEYLQSLCTLYLNRLLVWDANAGDSGMWRLVTPPTGDETPLWNFTTAANSPGTLAHKSAAYGANTSPILDTGPFSTYIQPPEGNILTCSTYSSDTVNGQGRGQMRITLINRKSWDLAGASQADPDNIDYLGRIVPIEYVDVTIGNRAALNFIARRVFNIACRGRKFAHFTAELVLVAPPGDALYTTHAVRPLRTGDLVTIDGATWMVHSANPHWTKDHLQYCDFEVEAFRPDVTWAYGNW